MRKGVTLCVLVGFIVLGSFYLVPLTQQQLISMPTGILIISQSDVPITINGNTELAQRSAGGAGTQSSPYLIADLSINITSGICLSILNTTSFFIISSSVLLSSDILHPVISFRTVENGVIEDCHFSGGSSCVEFTSCSDCAIRGSTCVDSHYGIVIEDSDNCAVVDCICQSNYVGVQVGSRDSLIMDCSIYKNIERGLYITSYDERTKIYHNNIGWNPVNALCNSNTTDFTDGVGAGNAWSDYDGSGVYTVPGDASEIDSFPHLLTDTISPTIDSPEDKAIDVEGNGETITWTASDDFPFTYRLYVDGIAQNAQTWDGRPIIVSLDTLSSGTHRMVMQVSDAVGNTANDEVLVTVVPFMLGGIGTELVMWGSVITIVAFLIVILILKKVPL